MTDNAPIVPMKRRSTKERKNARLNKIPDKK